MRGGGHGVELQLVAFRIRIVGEHMNDDRHAAGRARRVVGREGRIVPWRGRRCRRGRVRARGVGRATARSAARRENRQQQAHHERRDDPGYPGPPISAAVRPIVPHPASGPGSFQERSIVRLDCASDTANAANCCQTGGFCRMGCREAPAATDSPCRTGAKVCPRHVNLRRRAPVAQWIERPPPKR